MATLFDYSEYDLPIPPSDEVLHYEETWGKFLEFDWQRRAYKDFETGSRVNRISGLGALACSLTRREVIYKIHELDAHFDLELVPDYIDFEH